MQEPSQKQKHSRRRLAMALMVVGLLVVALAGWAYAPFFLDHSLTFKWEGIVPGKKNFRDAGASINSCHGETVLPEHQLFRANEFFSGWACDDVGNPDVVLSLNYSKSAGERFYCRRSLVLPRDILIGESYQELELSDLEFLKTWLTNDHARRASCDFVKRARGSIHAGQRLLLHCEAGRDRTGALTAIMAALLIEDSGKSLDQKMLDAIECDYRKSRSLTPEKYGRIKNFLSELLVDYGSISKFISAQCAD